MGQGRAAAALLCLALVACAKAVAPPPPAPVHPVWPGCEAVGAFAEPYGTGGPADLGAVPVGFEARTVVLCERGERTVRGVTVQVDLERTSTEVAPLLTYLARPSEPRTDGPCPAMAVLPPWLYLLDPAGRYVAPAIPTDGCGFPLGRLGGDPGWTRLIYTDRVVREH